MKRILAATLAIVFAEEVFSQETSTARITHFDKSGRMEFTTSLIASNKAYRVEYAPALPGPWFTDMNQLVFTTNELLSFQLDVPAGSKQRFFRVARTPLALAAINQSNVVAIVAHEDGERLAFINDTNVVVAYTAQSGKTAILRFSTNGLPERLIDGEHVFLFRNYTSSSIDVGIVWPGGSNSVVRGVPVDQVDLAELQRLKGALSAGGFPGLHSSPELEGASHNLHDVIQAGLVAISVVGCATAVAAGPASALLAIPICSKALIGALAYLTGNETVESFNKILGIMLCVEPPHIGCIPTVIGLANEALLDSKTVQDVQANQIQEALNELESPEGMVFIPGGSFAMGDTIGDGRSDELPIHTVYVSAFYMDRYEVTKELWNEVSTWAISHGYSFESTGSAKGALHPAQVGLWYDAVKWCNARSEMDGRRWAYFTSAAQSPDTVYRVGRVDVRNNWVNWNGGYRLPTEAEWEKAARGGLNGKRFPWGDTISHSQANYESSSWFPYDISPTRGYHPNYTTTLTSPVGSFAANGYGLFDMAGNVFEWCWDWYGDYDAGPDSDPRGPASGSHRLDRGGSWWLNADQCRVSFRTYSSWDIGFRCVLPPD